MSGRPKCRFACVIRVLVMSQQLFDLPADFCGEVRLFPLPKLVLFPHNVQPLHIFESRYREMMEDALSGDGLIAMATLEDGFETDYYSRPSIERAVCIGRVATHKEHADGTFDLVLIGIRRASVQHEVSPPRSYRQAVVQVLEDQYPKAAAEASRLAGKLINRFRQLVPAAEKLTSDVLDGSILLGTLTDVVSFHLPLDLRVKLRLLAETNVVVRAELLLEHLAARPAATSQAKRFPPRFSVN